MNVTLPEKPKGSNRRIAIYMLIFILCVIAVGIAIYQFFADEKLGVIVGITSAKSEYIEELKLDFNNLFENKLVGNTDEQNIKKIVEDKNLVYTNYEKQENSLNNYDINVHIPYINIDTDKVKKQNEEIKDIFEQIAEKTLQTQNRNIVYNVNYMACTENNILYVVILSTFKEGTNVQRTIVQTYNYDLINNKEVTINDVIKNNNIDKNELQNRIKTEIEKAQKQAEELKNAGYSIFARNSKDDIYKLENATEFFVKDGYLYLIYAYGNQNETSEMDIVIY